jgi:hypothetical protein
MSDFDLDNMTQFLRITKKMVDPITFSEKFDVVCASDLEDSLIDQTYYQGMQADGPKKAPGKKIKQRRFSEEVEVFIIPDLDAASMDDMFYREEEIADFRHEAFLESCGLSSDDFSNEFSTGSELDEPVSNESKG